ncbi:MAG: hypothetical protein ABR511_02770 [Acidimicrobiales bacterium]
MKLTAEELAYRARALAQAHPLTPLAKRYLDSAVAVQRTSQPVPEIGIWAGASLLNGYCLRRVEEDDLDVHLEAADDDAALPDLERLDEVAQQVAAELRTDDADRQFLGDGEVILEALDRLISSDISRRIDHWRETIDASATAELEEYLTWWVVKGYALRVAETRTGALA